MDLLQLRYFRVVARHEHMTNAATELSIAQPSLSKTIRRLEHELGVPLFDRRGRSIRLNRFGSVFLTHMDALFRELEEGRRKVRDLAGLEQGEVSLVAASLIWLPRLLHRFQARHPGVQFHLVQCTLDEMAQRLETGACDFCFRSVPLTKAGIQWRTLQTHDLLLVVPAAHRLAGHKRVPLRAVAQEAVVIETVGNGLRDAIDRCCRQAGVTPRIVYEVDEPAAILEFVEAELGVAFAPASIAQQLDKRAVATLELTDPGCHVEFGVAWHNERYLAAAARAFLDFVIDAYATPELEAPARSPVPDVVG